VDLTVPRSDLAPARFDSYYLFYRFTSAALYHTSCCTLRALTYFVLVVSNQGQEIFPVSKIETNNNSSNKLEQLVVSNKAKELVAVSKIEKKTVSSLAQELITVSKIETNSTVVSNWNE
jgi:hypothetical protein